MYVLLLVQMINYLFILWSSYKFEHKMAAINGAGMYAWGRGYYLFTHNIVYQISVAHSVPHHTRGLFAAGSDER